MTRPHVVSRGSLIGLVVFCLLVGAGVALLLHSIWPISLTSISKWVYAFSTSAGLGGIAALIAAGIAYRGVVRSASVSRKTAFESQWWTNARWAADRLLSASSVQGDEAYAVELEEDYDDLLTDQDAYAAIVMLSYLGENAPSDEAGDFAVEVLGAVLGVDSTSLD